MIYLGGWQIVKPKTLEYMCIFMDLKEEWVF